LPQIPVMITGSLQGRIDLQGVPCKPYRVWVCSVGFDFKCKRFSIKQAIF
jgi:hypothetical protein